MHVVKSLVIILSGVHKSRSKSIRIYCNMLHFWSRLHLCSGSTVKSNRPALCDKQNRRPLFQSTEREGQRNLDWVGRMGAVEQNQSRTTLVCVNEYRVDFVLCRHQQWVKGEAKLCPLIACMCSFGNIPATKMTYTGLDFTIWPFND